MQVEEPVQANSIQTALVEVPSPEVFYDASRIAFEDSTKPPEEIHQLDHYINQKLRDLGGDVFVYSIQALHRRAALITYSRR